MKLIVLVCLMAVCNIMYGVERIRGRVADAADRGIEGVAVILQTGDSVYVDAWVTDSTGVFAFEVGEGRYRLLFQHLLYEAYLLEDASGDVGSIVLEEKDYRLGEVSVSAERPQVKVSGGTLIYDVPALLKDKAATNAFEVVRELPGMMAAGDDLRLVGAGRLSIILNGQPTSLSMEQLIALLKTIPASRVARAEIMYNAPARYNVKGALVNVVIDAPAEEGNTLQGEAGTEYRQHRYGRESAHATLLYATPRLSVDGLVNGTLSKSIEGETMFARHSLPEQTVEIEQDNKGETRAKNGSLRLEAAYTFANEDRLSATYYLSAGAFAGERSSASLFNYLTEGSARSTRSTTSSDEQSILQNARLQYTGHQGLSAGADLTLYHNPDKVHFMDSGESSTPVDLRYDTRQDVSKWTAFLNHTHTLHEDWELSYGAAGSYSSSDTWISYLQSAGRQTEYGGSLFAEVSHAFGAHLSATLSLKGEYFRSDYTSNGQSSVLWDDAALFPNASLSYVFTPSHVLQLHVHSDKQYPSYWAVNPQVTPLNSYTEIHGNPALKPSRSYEGQLLYILRQKYILALATEYAPDRFIQMPYQSASELKNVFRMENLDFSLQSSLSLIIPVKAGRLLDSRLTLAGVRMQDKSSRFYDTPFDHTHYFGQAVLSNTLSPLPACPNLKLTLSGYYVSSAIQGIYTLGRMYDVSTALKWTFAGERGTLTLKYNNIFNSQTPHSIRINTGRQYSRMRTIDDSGYIGIAFSWTFGGYKEKAYDKVDDSRFGK